MQEMTAACRFSSARHVDEIGYAPVLDNDEAEKREGGGGRRSWSRRAVAFVIPGVTGPLMLARVTGSGTGRGREKEVAAPPEDVRRVLADRIRLAISGPAAARLRRALEEEEGEKGDSCAPLPCWRRAAWSAGAVPRGVASRFRQPGQYRAGTRTGGGGGKKGEPGVVADRVISAGPFPVRRSRRPVLVLPRGEPGDRPGTDKEEGRRKEGGLSCGPPTASLLLCN